MIQRPRNRQGRVPPQSDGRGRGRGRRHGDRPDGPTFYHNVPTTQQVITGAVVSIILKDDQPTGREVQGAVASVLTRGDHPRGIKVRLIDGRVGRVQRIITGEERAQSIHTGGLDYSDGRSSYQDNGTSPAVSSVRYPEMDRPAPGFSLEAFLPAGHPLREDPARTTATHPESLVTDHASQVCPVCGQFEGDEVAVSHHVATHFD